MRIIYAISFVLCFTNGFTQDISYFDGNPIWRIERGHLAENMFDIEYIQYVYFLQGDSTINGQFYHKLYSHGWNEESVLFDRFEGLLRQDGKKIFTVGHSQSSNEDEEYLLYDFSLEVGDTLPNTLIYYQNPTNSAIVESIDSILIDNQYHKIFYSNDYEIDCIEGIGHSQGFYEEGMSTPFDYVYSLNCFTKNDEQVIFPIEQLPDWFGGDCDYTIGIEELGTEIALEVYPNPTENTIHISADQMLNSISIKSINGKEIIRQTASTKKVSLDVSSRSAGVYILDLEMLNGNKLFRRVQIR